MCVVMARQPRLSASEPSCLNTLAASNKRLCLAQETNMFRLMDLVAEEHANQVWALSNAGADLKTMQQLRAAADSSGNSPRSMPAREMDPPAHGAKPLAAGSNVQESTPESNGSSSGTGGLRPRDALAVRLVSKLTAIVVRHLPDLWHMPQERIAAMPGVGAAQQAATVQDATAALADLVQDFTEAYKCATVLIASILCFRKHRNCKMREPQERWQTGCTACLRCLFAGTSRVWHCKPLLKIGRRQRPSIQLAGATFACPDAV